MFWICLIVKCLPLLGLFSVLLDLLTGLYLSMCLMLVCLDVRAFWLFWFVGIVDLAVVAWFGVVRLLLVCGLVIAWHLIGLLVVWTTDLGLLVVPFGAL